MKLHQRAVYGLPRFGSSLLLNSVTLATVFIYHEYFQLDPFLNGFANGVGKLVIAFSSILGGQLSDRFQYSDKLGRRKPFIFIGAPLMAFAFVLMFAPQWFISLGDQISLFFWLLLFNGAFQFAYGFLMTPYSAWMPELTDPEERVQVSGFSNAFGTGGTAVGAALTFLLPGILEGADIRGSEGILLTQIVILFALVQILLFLPPIFAIPTENKTHWVERTRLRDEFEVLKTNRNYLLYTLAHSTMSIGFITLSSLFVGYFDEILQFGMMELAIVGGLNFVLVPLLFFFWGVLAARVKKKRALIFALLWISLILPGTYIVGQVPGIDVTVQGLIFMTLLVFGFSGYYLLPPAILADIIHADEIEKGEGRAGLYTGFEGVPLNIFQFIGLSLTGVILGLPKLLPVGENFGYLVFGPFCAFFIFLGTLIFALVDADPIPEDWKGQNTQEG